MSMQSGFKPIILVGPKGYGDRKNAILGHFTCY